VKIAVIGAGISGLACAWRLSGMHEVTLYESERYLGGHTHTVDATVDGLTYPVDTGFLVYNHRTYPTLVRLFEQLGIVTSASEMSFSVGLIENGVRGLEWAGTDLNSVFAQRRNLVNPRFLVMLRDILRFNARATALAQEPDTTALHMTLGQFLDDERFGQAFRDWYLLPMAAAIWSCSTAQMAEYPLATFVRFCHNHGLLQVTDRPQWYTVRGGAREYVEVLAKAIPEVRINDKALGIVRGADPAGRVTVRGSHDSVDYDQVVLACHTDQAQALLLDASDEERSVLGAIRYQQNHAVLHTDAAVLPTRRRAWAAWNYQRTIASDASTTSTTSTTSSVCVHYLLNRLQPLPFQRPVIVSLNAASPPAPETILGEYDYSHPVFDLGAIKAQARLPHIQGARNTWFAGAWTGYGFHEDGLKSGLAAAEGILAQVPAAAALAA
jgi:predicted NAD/FAD-binding protein